MASLNLQSLLGLLPVVGPVIAALPEFKEVYDAAASVLHPADQVTAKAGYADLIADNADGFARLDAKLEAAKKR